MEQLRQKSRNLKRRTARASWYRSSRLRLLTGEEIVLFLSLAKPGVTAAQQTRHRVAISDIRNEGYTWIAPRLQSVTPLPGDYWKLCSEGCASRE